MDIDFSQLLPVSKFETISPSSSCDEILDQNFMDIYQDIDFSSLFHDIVETKTLNCDEPIDIKLDIPETNSNPLSCVNTVCKEKKKNKIYKCSECDKSFSRNSNLIQHRVIHEKKPTVPICSVCDKTFSKNSYLKQHMKTHNKRKVIENTEECPTCGKTFQCKSYLKTHMEIHTCEKLFSCEVCLKAFKTKRVLKRHQLLHNTNEEARKHLCEHCGCTFTRKDQFKQHVSHYQNSIYACIQCKKKFCRHSYLKAHIREFHTVGTDLVQTTKQNPYCEKVKCFKRKNEMRECSTTTFGNNEDITLDLQTFLNNLNSSVENEMNYQLVQKQYFKCCFTLEANVTPLNGKENEFYTLYLNSNTILIFSENMIAKCIKQVFDEMIEQYLRLKTQWRLCKIIKLEILSIKFNSI